MKLSQIDVNKELQCRFCDFNFLHHRAIQVYDRREDDTTTRVTSVVVTDSVMPTLVGQVQSPSDRLDSPSLRRGAIVIEFECEGCRNTPKLAISQHKGTTSIGWLK